MVPTTETVLQRLREVLPVLKQRYPIEPLKLVGSYARGEQTETSDVDLLVYLHPSVGLGFADLESELQAALGVQVDLIEVQGLKPWWLAEIEKSLVNVE